MKSLLTARKIRRLVSKTLLPTKSCQQKLSRKNLPKCYGKQIYLEMIPKDAILATSEYQSSSGSIKTHHFSVEYFSFIREVSFELLMEDCNNVAQGDFEIEYLDKTLIRFSALSPVGSKQKQRHSGLSAGLVLKTSPEKMQHGHHLLNEASVLHGFCIKIDL